MRNTRLVVAAFAVVAAAGIAVEAAPADPRPAVIEFVATDYSFEGPATAPAGYLTVRMSNQGRELHHVTLVRLEDGKTMADLHAVMSAGAHAFPEWAVEVGGPNAAAPGQTIEASMVLREGRYAVLCLIPSPDGVPHVMKGMSAELVVEGRAAGGSPARTDAEMVLHDYTFRLSAPLRAGTQTLRVRTEASQAHEVVVVRLMPGKTARDFLGWVEKPEGPPPGALMGGVAGMAPGEWNDLTLTLEKGRHALLCFLPDRTDGQPHFVHGMVMELEVE